MISPERMQTSRTEQPTDDLPRFTWKLIYRKSIICYMKFNLIFTKRGLFDVTVARDRVDAGC